MFSAFFGHYLLNKGFVDAATLSKLLENQDNVRTKLGLLAIDSGYMTAVQVEYVHSLQHTLDKRFGEIAVAMEYMTDTQVSELLSQQKAEHLLLAQSLIDEKIMDYASYENELLNYKKAHSLNDDEFEAIKSGNIEIVVKAFTAFETQSESSFYTDYISLFVKNLIRFIDSNVRIDRVEKIEHIDAKHIFKQEIQGSRHFFTAYSGTDDALLTVAGKNANEVFTELDDYAIDSASEFLNLHNGLYIVNESECGLDLNLTVQEYINDSLSLPRSNYYRIPIYLTHGTLYIYLGL